MGGVLIDELILFSDHHAHNFPYGAKDVKYKNYHINSRLLAGCNVLRQIGDYAHANRIDKIVFAGDLFHVREAVTTDVVYHTREAIRYMVRHNKKLYAIPGNHDYYDRFGHVHSLSMIADIPGVHVIDHRSACKHVDLFGKRGDAYKIHFVPYTDDRNEAVKRLQAAGEAATKGKWPELLVAHLGMQGAKVGSDYVLVSDQDLTVDDVPYDRFTACFFGHYHQHQKLFRNGWFIGASHQHNWGDVNTKRGFLHVRLYVDHVEFDFIETDAPRFVSFKEDNPLPVNPGDFVRVLTDRKLDEDQVKSVREDLGTENCEVVYVPPEVETGTMELSEENLSPENMVAAWVAANEDWLKTNMDDVAHEDLIAYGRSLLASAAEKT